MYNDVYYVTVPRWKRGVPSSLATVVMKDNKPVLRPWPSWEMNDYRKGSSALWYVQSMEIDPATGLMWVIDVGRLNIFDAGYEVNGVPKLLLLDMATGQKVHEYLFPDDIASHTQSFLNDIAVDHSRGVAYISEAGTGALITYSLATNTARRYASVHTAVDPTAIIKINGVLYDSIKIPEDGITLDPRQDVLYFCALTGAKLFSVPASALRDFALSNDEITKRVTVVGAKPPSDGLAFASNGRLYYGDLNDNAVYEWDVSKPFASGSKLLVQNNETMQWPDTFAFDGKNNIIFTANKLQHFFSGTMVFPDPAKPATLAIKNFYIVRVNIGANSYLDRVPVVNHPEKCTLNVALRAIDPVYVFGTLLLGVILVLLVLRNAPAPKQ